ncbi:reverse transcriptase domain-containing protein [Tanacetum coccineum]
MDTESGKGVPRHEAMYSRTTNGNHVKTQRRADNVPLCGQRSDKCGLTSGKRLAANTVHATRRLRRYFQAYLVVVIKDQPIKQILSRSEHTRRMLKWKFKLEAFDITYGPRTSIRGQVLADFIVERPDEESPQMEAPAEQVTPELWTLFTNSSSCLEGSGAGLILTSPEGEEFTYALRFEFDASNNEAEYEALVAVLRIAEQMGVQNLVAKVDSRLIANQINGSYKAKEQSMIQYLEKSKALIDNFKMFSIEQKNEKSLLLWKKRVALIEYLAKGTLPAKTKKARAIKIKARQYTMINDVLYKKSSRTMLRTAFRPGDFIYRSNEASHAKESGKLCPKWEGSYGIVEALGKRAYKLKNKNGDILPRTWNVKDLKKCTDNAKITRKRSKPGKHEQQIG